jgi:dolichol-phosphate mannosyltransferase
MPINFSLVIPTYNEEKNLEDLCCQIFSVLDRLHFNFEIIIVDDNSPDQTWRVAEDLAKQDRRIKIIRRMHDRGLASAVVLGWASCQGEILGVIDGDMQHPPAVLTGMLNKILNNLEIDIVVASRYINGGMVLNRRLWQTFKSKLAIFLGKMLVPRIFTLIKDPLSGYFILRRKVIEGKKLSPIGFKVLLEVLAKGEYKKVIELPYIFNIRKKGRSKAGLWQFFISLLHFIKISDKKHAKV